MVPGYLISAVVYGTLFALMAMGLTLTYMTTKVPNFAYGSFVTIGLYTAFHMSSVYHVGPYVASMAAFVIAGLVSVVMYVAVLRPLARRGTPLVALMIATFGVDIGFIGIIGIYTDYMATTYRLVTAKQFFALPGDFSLFGVQGIVYAGPAILAAITILVYLLFTRTRFGIAMRASVENAPLARILGINVERVNVVSWMLAGGFAGIAGSLFTLWFPGGTSTGSDLIVEIFASSVLGGLTSIFGAVVGGLVIGSSEDLVPTYLGIGLGYLTTAVLAIFIVAVGVLLVRRRLSQPRVFAGGSKLRAALTRKVVVSGSGGFGYFLVLMGAYMLFEMATGYTSDFFVGGIVYGFGADITPYQKAIPLLVMIATLLILPKGIVSINLRGLRRKK